MLLAIPSMSAQDWKRCQGQIVDGKFPLRQWLGGSDSSAVFLTEQDGPDSPQAAIKLMAADAANADQQLSQWHEASQLSHPHLLRIFASGVCELGGADLPTADLPAKDILYVVMEYAEENLSQILPQRALTPAEVADMLPPALEALSYLHGRDLVHGHLRPSNILAVDNQLKLSIDHVRNWVRASGDLAPAPDSLSVYDAPEVAKGELSPAVDVWSLGVTLVETLTQRLPENAAPQQKDPAVPDTIPEPFRSIAREALHRAPMQRCTIADIKAWRPPQSAPVVEAALVPQVATAAAAPASAAVKPTRMTWRMLIPIAVLVIAGAFVGLHDKLFPPKPTATAQQFEIGQVPNSGTAAPVPATAPPQTASRQTAPPLAEPAAKKENIPASSRGEVVQRVLPKVSKSAQQTITGKIKVMVRVEVNASGKVTSAKLTSPGPSKYFANLALNAARSWEFTAPQVGGQNVPSAWNVKFLFGRTSTQAIPERAR